MRKSHRSKSYWIETTLTSKELLSIIQSEYQVENNLISHRMSWYVASQSFLMASFAVSGGAKHSFPWLTTLIPALGIVTSIITFFALLAAIGAIRNIYDYRESVLSRDSTLQKIEIFTKRHRLKRDTTWLKFWFRIGWIDTLGLLPPVLTPVIFFAAWITAFSLK